MKKLYAFFISLIVAQCVLAQSFSPTAIVSAGNATTTPDGVYVSWSVGETFVTTLSSGNVILTQGFQQPTDGIDADGDGFTANVDCDDNNMDIYPGAPELCDGLDNDCNSLVDDGLALSQVFVDLDGDGFGNPNDMIETCDVPAGYVADNSDCNDANMDINPLAIEICDNIDNNCDGTIDEGVGQVFFMDNDGDGFGDMNMSTEACVLPAGYSDNSDDCNDLDANINPNIAEICDAVDNDCDGQIDNGLTFSDYYSDADGDGYGVNLVGSFCAAQAGSATLSGDCNDADPTINPGATEVCSPIDENCNSQINEGLTSNDVPFVVASTALYPTCSNGNLLSANLNNGTNTAVIAGDGPDLWYKITSQFNTFRASLSAATGDNTVSLYQDLGGCLVLLQEEHEVTSGNQILLSDDLTPGGIYYVAVHKVSGNANTSAKICFNHFVASTCDHVYSGNTGIYANSCISFKAQFKANASSYIFNVLSGTQGGVDMGITPWSYTTPTSSSIITRIGTLLPANISVSPRIYNLSVGVTYAMYDAANNLTPILADPTATCTAQMNPENPVVLRSSDRCPAFKAITSSIATDRQICGATRYEWEITQTAPVAAAPVTVQGGLNTNVLFLSNVPGMANAKTYSVRVRPLFTNAAPGAYGAAQCMKTTGAGMVMEENQDEVLAALNNGSQMVVVYPNPSSTGQIVLQWNQPLESDLKVKLFNGMGQLVYGQRYFEEGATMLPVPVQNVASGIYLLEVELNGTVESHRVVISK